MFLYPQCLNNTQSFEEFCQTNEDSMLLLNNITTSMAVFDTSQITFDMVNSDLFCDIALQTYSCVFLFFYCETTENQLQKKENLKTV